ncbi:MAG TPA: hypothetical protein VFG10_04670 [Saprospiraceae bacterium]|nr:hypothetical protein [Saprospiraceae bacterium]
MAVLFIGCQSQAPPTDIKNLHWLLGNWKGEASGQPFYETWTKVSDTELANINYGITNGDTTISGRSKIELLDNKIYYKSENRSLELISSNAKESVFENKLTNEKFKFSLNDQGQWVALLVYPTSQVEYKLNRQ